MRLFLYGLIVSFLLFVSGCAHQNNSAKDKLAPKKSFFIRDVDDRNTTVKIDKQKLTIERVSQQIVIIHLFTTRAELCRAMPPYLSNLQRKYGEKVFVLGIVVPEAIESTQLRSYMLRNEITFFVSNSQENLELGQKLANLIQLDSNYPLPTTIVFGDGKVYAHYEGITPIEMIYNDLYKLDPTLKRKKK